MRWSFLPIILAAMTSLHAEAAQGIPEAVEELAGAVGKEFVDPAKHERVVFDFTLRSVWGESSAARIAGWRDPKTNALFLDDGFPVPEPDQRKVEASDLAKTRPSNQEKKTEKEESDDTFSQMKQVALGLGGEARIPHAAWMAASGDTKGAAALLERVRFDEDHTFLTTWRSERVWFHFATMVHAFIQRQDDVVLAHGQFLEARYSELTKEEQPQAFELLGEVRRLKTAPAVSAPEKITGLPANQQITAWIDRLQEVAVPQDSQPGGVDLAQAPEVQALIRIGEPAIPALIDCFEHDTRLTRSVHFWRDFRPSRTVLGVHEAALTAIMSILRTEFYSPGATGSNVTGGGKERRGKLAADLRAYWKRYGQSSFDERMMAVLTDKSASKEARREAALNLATPNAKRTYGTTVWTGSWENSGGKNPGIEKFKEPAIFEAILGALDDEIASIHAEAKRRPPLTEENFGTLNIDPEKNPIDVPRETRYCVSFFASALADLQDPRAAVPLTARAAEATDPAIRATLATAAHRIGNSSALNELCRLLVAKELPAPEPKDQRAFSTLYAALCADPGTRRDGLAAIAKRDNPWFLNAFERVVSIDAFSDESKEVLSDPWCLILLEEALQDTRETAFTDLIKKDDEDGWQLFHREPNGNGNLGDATPYLDESKYDREWKLRVCDRACAALLKLLGDHTEKTYQPIAKDREKILDELRAYLARYRDTFQELSDYLDGGTGFSIEGGRFLPILPPLDRAATSEDVAAGRAVFRLPNAGEKPVMTMPLCAEWLAQKSSGTTVGGPPHGRFVVILQVERDADGGLWFGIADGNGFHVVPDKEIGILQALPDGR